MPRWIITCASEPDGRANSRNGFGAKTVLTDTGSIDLDIPRDRLATFDPKLIAKYQRRFPGFDDKVISMYARGMSTREIQGHLQELYGLDVSPDLISKGVRANRQRAAYSVESIVETPVFAAAFCNEEIKPVRIAELIRSISRFRIANNEIREI